jgi:putative redox protein
MVNLGELMRNLRNVALRGNPAECAEPMSGVTRQVVGLRSEAAFGELKMVIDEPVVFGGTGSAPNPAEAALAALGASMEVTLRCWAEYLQIPVTSISVALSGALDSRGFFATDPAVRSGFGHISATIRVDSPASAEQLDQLLSRVQQCCPVLDLFRAPTPVTVTLARQVAGSAR